MVGKRRWQKRKQFSTELALGRAKAEQVKGRDKTMLQKKTEYWQEVRSE